LLKTLILITLSYHNQELNLLSLRMSALAK